MVLLNLGKPDFSKDTRIGGERTSATEISNPIITTTTSSASFVTKGGTKMWEFLGFTDG
jgi:hypothetical protein